MATLIEVYAKFGETAEAAQLFETELGSVLLGVNTILANWHVEPDPASARKLLDDIEGNTLGKLLGALKTIVQLDDHLAEHFTAGLKARNRLFHGFYEKHSFKIQTDEGRDVMLKELEALHATLTAAYHRASAMSGTLIDLVNKDKEAGGRDKVIN